MGFAPEIRPIPAAVFLGAALIAIGGRFCLR
jgi:hypothetical protein